jgi:hypothetical protein
MAKYLLVSFKTCPGVQRAAIVLREKKIDFEFRSPAPPIPFIIFPRGLTPRKSWSG